MIYAALRSALLALLRVPLGPPDPPAGSHGSVRVFRASPRFLTYRLLLVLIGLVSALGLVAVLAVSALLARDGGPAVAAGVVSLVALPLLFSTYFLVRVDYDLRYYVVTDRSLRVRTGAWTVREMTITFANVQNLRIVQGPLMRLFGIRNLRVDVAGGGSQKQHNPLEAGHHVTVAGIEDAVALRDAILAHLRQSRAGGGLGDPDDVETRARETSLDLFGSARVLAALEALAAASRALSQTARARRG